MSSLSNQPASTPFSEYSELCKSSLLPEGQHPVPQKIEAGGPGWEWQRTEGRLSEIGMPLSLGGPSSRGSTAPVLTDEDKLCFFDGSAAGSLDTELKVPVRLGGGGGASLGSAGESPESPLSSSPSSCGKSPASPGKLLEPLSCTNNSVLSATLMGSPASTKLPDVSVSEEFGKMGSTSVWNPSFSAPPEPSSHPPLKGAPNYCVIGVVNDNYLEGSGGHPGGGSSEDSAEEVEPCLPDRVAHQRKAMRRALSECSHLSVPSCLELPDKYPCPPASGEVAPNSSGRRPHSAMRRSLTVSDEQPPTPPPTINTPSLGALEKSDGKSQSASMGELANHLSTVTALPTIHTDPGSFSHTFLEGIPEYGAGATAQEKKPKESLLATPSSQNSNAAATASSAEVKEEKPQTPENKQEKPEKQDKAEKEESAAQKAEKSDKAEKAEKPVKVEKAEKTQKVEKAGKAPATNGISAAPNKTLPPSPEKKTKLPESRSPEKRPPVPKASSATPSARAPPVKNTSSTAPSKSPGAPRAPTVPRTTASATPPRRPTSIKTEVKTDAKAGEVKKPSTLKTPPGDFTRPRTTPTKSNATTPSTPGLTPAPRSRTPKTPTTASAEKKPATPRAPPKTSPAPRTPVRPATAPTHDIKNVRSKVGSTDNMKHQPGGGKGWAGQRMVSAPVSRGPQKESSQGTVQIITKKLDFSHVTSRCGSKDNIKHVPGGGNIQILNKKVDLSKVTSKCGSKANIKHKPGGGEVKIETHKVSFKEKAQSKVGSMDNVSHEPGGGNIKAEGAQEAGMGDGAPVNGALAQALTGSVAQENGMRETVPCGGDGHRDSQGLDSHIPETSI
ncbi:microtubule-associated protein 4 isoform X8 [Lepisosteus oculatus]|uniref:microtubule-associated protein 4 isoform X8 n=1 Tax=Lepisosteus oculatus TaxID=7918 RepID=UPI003711EB5D